MKNASWTLLKAFPGIELAKTERVIPVMYALPAPSTAMPLAVSALLPPANVEYTSEAPVGANFVTKASKFAGSAGFREFTAGKLAEFV